MKAVAKLVIVDNQDNYLMMFRNNHPTFGDDPDLPGGTAEADESMLTTMVREVKEEIGVDIVPSNAIEIFSGTQYSTHGTHYSLFTTRLSQKPPITISWEHSSYRWLDKQEFISVAKSANDTYMHMVGDTLEFL